MHKLFAVVGLAGTLFLSSACSTPVGRGDDLGIHPYLDWKTIETAHFQITYPVELAVPAKRVAELYEEAWTLITRRLRWAPGKSTQVLLLDNADAANGLTSPLAGFGMVLYITPPDNWFSTARYDDWLRLLVLHEYTHFVNMDTTASFWGPLRALFGDTLLPNAAWPPWMLEGLAVWMETRLTTAGRGRSPYYDMVLRKAVEEGVFDTSAFFPFDRIQGDAPWNPQGEARYLFGYFLMNQLTEEELGRYSLSSGGRIPYLQNATLGRLKDQSWSELWEQWVAQTRKHAEAELAALRARPLTPLTRLTQNGLRTLGSAFSPDGKRVAYSQETLHDRFSIWIRDVDTGQARILAEKGGGGASVAFTPDGRHVLFSSLERQGVYRNFSDLSAVDVESGRITRLTNGLRAKDPDVSRDGKWVVFTLARDASIGLALAELRSEDGRPRLGRVRLLWAPNRYSAAYTPKFSADGKKVIFSVHPNGVSREDLHEIDVAGGAARVLLSNGRYNRFPAVAPEGTVYFVSDANGVDNVHRLAADGRAIPVTQVTGGLAFPAVGPGGAAVAASYASSGWDLVSLKLTDGSPEPFAGVAALAPPESVPSAPVDAASVVRVPEKSYSALKTLAPRQWSPIAYYDGSSFLLGALLMGADTLDFHRYYLSGDYYTLTGSAEWSAYYAYRGLGPTFVLSGTQYISSTLLHAAGDIDQYARKANYGLTTFFPIRGTFSTLLPQIAIKAERLWIYDVDLSQTDPLYKSRYVPTVDFAFSFSDSLSTALAVAPEYGRSTLIAARAYVGAGTDGAPSWKGLIKDTENFRLGEHSVLSPSAKFSWTSGVSSYTPARVLATGRASSLTSAFSTDDLAEIAIRGYPGTSFLARAMGKVALDYRFPLWRVYRGVDVHPAYANQFFGFLFGESSFFPRGGLDTVYLPSFGGGLRFSTEWFYIFPLVLSVEYHQGTQTAYGGRGELFFQAGFSNFSF